jgi:FAD/FMN-containing dehydrogenase
MMPQESVQKLRALLRGELIQPGDSAYDAARRVYNAMIDRRPEAIARCADVADVAACVRFAADQGWPAAIRCGGHNGAGLGVCDAGIVIDLSRMKGIRIDPAAQTVRVEGGCTWADVDHATHGFGLAVPSGVISTTGVGGLTLGGGIGHLTRKYGLTIDNLLAADIVLADGRLVTASAEENPDLFWALRGGGGNFGVVSSFLFRAHPVRTVMAGPTLWPLEQAAGVMRLYREFLPSAPEDVNGFFAFMVVPPAPPFPEALHGKTMCAIVWCCTGGQSSLDAIELMRRYGKPAFDMVGELPMPALNSMFDALYPPGLQWYWRADFVNELNDQAIDLHVRHGAQLPTMHSTMHLYPINGAAHRTARDATAFSFRESHWAEVIVGVDPSPAKADVITNYAKSYWDALHPYSAGGAYVNFMMEEGQERVQATYRDNYARLLAVKQQYDPDNLFQVNQNIRAASASAAHRDV